MPREAARKVITDAMVQKVKPAPKGKRNEYWDAIVPGFGLRVTDAGGKSFFLRTRAGAEQLRMSWPYPATTLEAARAAAKAALDDLAQGIDPKAKKVAEAEAKAEKAANTFKTVGERFMRQHVEPRLALSTHREYKRALFGPDTLPDSHKSPKFPAMMDGFEAKEALEDDDWSRRSVVPGPAAEACANPCRIGERAFGMRVLLWSGPTFESGADGF